MTLDQLTTFRAISKTKSFRQAAALLHLTQPAVSKQIQSLEDELGERLVERGRQSSLTEAGEALLEHAEHLAQILQTARAQIADFRELRRGHLTIAASHTAGADMLPPIIGKYRARYPHVTLTVETGWAREILGRVTAGHVDLGIVLLSSPHLKDAPRLFCAPLQSSETVFVAAPGFPGVTKSRLTFDEFQRMPLIVNHKGSVYRQYLEQRFAERGAAMNIAVEVLGRHLEKRLTQLGLGASLLSRSLVARELKEKSLRSFKVSGLEMRSYCCLVYGRDKYVHGPMRGMLKLLDEVFPLNRPPRRGPR
jgi:DNA-binding transcriptional LysR family regulator